MNALGVWGQFFSMAILGLVLWAAVSDLLFRRIPNAAVVSIVLVEGSGARRSRARGNGERRSVFYKAGQFGLWACSLRDFFFISPEGWGAGDVKLAAVLSFGRGLTLSSFDSSLARRRTHGFGSSALAND